MNPEEIIRQRREQDKFLGDERYKALQEIWKKYGKDSPEAKAAAEEYQSMNLKRPGEIEAREGRRKDAELYRQMLKDTGTEVDRRPLEKMAKTGESFPGQHRLQEEIRFFEDQERLEDAQAEDRYASSIDAQLENIVDQRYWEREQFPELDPRRHYGSIPYDKKIHDSFLAKIKPSAVEEGVAEQELRKEEGVLPESITPDLLMAGPGEDEFDDVPERKPMVANAKVLPKSLTPELLMAEDDSETPMSAIDVLQKIKAEEELPLEKQDKPNGIPRVDTTDLMADMDTGVDDLDLGNEGQYSDSMIAEEEQEQEEEERGGGFRKPTYRSTHYERTKNLPPSKLAEKMQANKERRQMKRMMRNMMKGRRNAK